jgi:metal-sulfur cluster biosynthetic enzyme
MTETQVLDVLRNVIDPEIGVNVVDLGLIYALDLSSDCIYVEMTMTTPTCPLGELILEQAYSQLHQAFPAVRDVQVELVWSPPWSPERMSLAAKQQLGWLM